MQYLVFVLVFGISIFVQCFSIGNSASIPSYVNLCKRNDPDLSKCIIKTFNEIRPYLRKGIPEMNIPPSDPMPYYNISGKSERTKSAHFQAKTWNQVATGLMDVEIKNVTFDFDKATAFCSLFFPFIMLRGDYNIEGKVLLFEINSTGKFVANATNLVANVDLIGKYIEKDGQKYLEFVTVKPDLILDIVSLHYTNLIPGNELLSTTLNKAINENIKILFADLAPIIHDVFGELAKQYFNDVVNLFSISELFPED